MGEGTGLGATMVFAAVQAPQFATDARIRSTHCKSHEELEAEDMASMPHFKARAIKLGP